MRISLIVAMSENRVIGSHGGLPWRLSADLKRFKRLTMGHHIIMGRKTYESIGRLLPGRTSVIITRQAGYEVPGAIVAHSFDEALELAADDSEVFIVGGAEIYRQALPRADRVYLTRVHATVDGDTSFADFKETDWSMTGEESHPADDQNEYRHTFCVYDRKEVIVAAHR